MDTNEPGFVERNQGTLMGLGLVVEEPGIANNRGFLQRSWWLQMCRGFLQRS